MQTNATYHESVKKQLWEKENTDAYKEYRRKWNENPLNQIVEQAPIHLDIETSAVCNLMCPMCNLTIERLEGDKSAYKRGMMSFELFSKIIDDAASIGVSSIKFNWRGEPLMNPEIIRMISYAKSKGFVELLMNTNAVFLDEEMAKNLINAGIDKIIFSVDSVEKEKYEKIRVGAKYEETMNNIKRFAQLNDELGHKVQTRVQRVLLNETENEQRKFEEFFENIVDVIAYEDYVSYGDKECGKVKKHDSYPKFICSQPWQRIVISWDGKCYMCCCMEGTYEVGDINTMDLHSVWTSEKLQEVRKLHSEGKWYEVEKCEKCPFAYAT